MGVLGSGDAEHVSEFVGQYAAQCLKRGFLAGEYAGRVECPSVPRMGQRIGFGFVSVRVGETGVQRLGEVNVHGVPAVEAGGDGIGTVTLGDIIVGNRTGGSFLNRMGFEAAKGEADPGWIPDVVDSIDEGLGFLLRPKGRRRELIPGSSLFHRQ